MDGINRNFLFRQRPPEYIVHNVVFEELALLEMEVGLRGAVVHRPTTMEFTKSGVEIAAILVDFGLQHFVETILP